MAAPFNEEPAMFSFDKLTTFVSTLSAFTAPAHEVFAAVQKALATKGDITGEEARAIGFAASDAVGDLRIVIKGRDVLCKEAQREILGGYARIARQVVLALKG